MKTVTLSPSQMKTINKTTFDNDIIEIEENGIKYGVCIGGEVFRAIKENGGIEVLLKAISK